MKIKDIMAYEATVTPCSEDKALPRCYKMQQEYKDDVLVREYSVVHNPDAPVDRSQFIEMPIINPTDPNQFGAYAQQIKGSEHTRFDGVAHVEPFEVIDQVKDIASKSPF